MVPPPSSPPTPVQISCLCSVVQTPLKNSECLGYLSDPNQSLTRRIKLDYAADRFSGAIKTVPLGSLLSSQSSQLLPSHLALSRKERFGIAAAMVWAVLHLCGSPWLSENWDKDKIHLFLESSGVQSESLASNPSISYMFNSTAAAVATPTPLSLLAIEDFQSNQIRNKPLFALGILLIELCLNRPFEELRRESQLRDELAQKSVTALDDYEIAEKQTDKVYLDAGYSYGYAVQRCLRCEFPGRDVTKTFQFQQFRTHFFAGVVAPIQATFSMIPKSCASI